MKTVTTPEEAFEVLLTEFPGTQVCAKRAIHNFGVGAQIEWTLTAFTSARHCEQGNGKSFDEALEQLRERFHGSDPLKELAELAATHGMKLVPA